MNQMCQDVEIVGENSIPKLSTQNFLDIITEDFIKHKKVKRRKRKKKKANNALEKDVLAIQIDPSNSNMFLFKNLTTKKTKESEALKLSLGSVCPFAYEWFAKN